MTHLNTAQPQGMPMTYHQMLEVLGCLAPELSPETLDDIDGFIDVVANGVLNGPHGGMCAPYLGDVVHVAAKARLTAMDPDRTPADIYMRAADAAEAPPVLVQRHVTPQEDAALVKSNNSIADGVIVFSQINGRIKLKRQAHALQALRTNIVTQSPSTMPNDHSSASPQPL